MTRMHEKNESNSTKVRIVDYFEGSFECINICRLFRFVSQTLRKKGAAASGSGDSDVLFLLCTRQLIQISSDIDSGI